MQSKLDFRSLNLQSKMSPILSFAYVELDDDIQVFHAHPSTEILFPISGEGEIVGVDESFLIQEGCICIIPSHLTHTEKKPSLLSSFRYYSLKVSEAIRLGPSDFLKIDLEPSFTKELHSRLKTAYENSAKHPDEPLLPYLDALAFYLLLKDKLLKMGYQIGEDKAKPHSSFVFDVQNYLNSAYPDDIEMNALAEKYGMSRSSLEKRFKKETGITPKEYLSRKRLESAKYLLSTTDYPVGQIASLCGFSTAAYFVYFFRTETGFTPKHYRFLSSCEEK